MKVGDELKQLVVIDNKKHKKHIDMQCILFYKNYIELISNNHSAFNIHYHLILVIKYRRKVIDDNVSNRLKDIFTRVGGRYHVILEEWNHDIDHVHILIKCHPNTNISKFINAYKSASSRLIKKEYKEIRTKLYKDCFWSQSFCLLSTGGAPLDIIKKYIETQGEKI